VEPARHDRLDALQRSEHPEGTVESTAGWLAIDMRSSQHRRQVGLNSSIAEKKIRDRIGRRHEAYGSSPVHNAGARGNLRIGQRLPVDAAIIRCAISGKHH